MHQALVFLVDEGKTNTTGRLDEHGALRHKEVLLCCQGALARYFWVQFHVMGKPCPDFSPDFSDPNYGEFGRRDWYKFFVFPSSEGDDVEMSYKSK